MNRVKSIAFASLLSPVVLALAGCAAGPSSDLEAKATTERSPAAASAGDSGGDLTLGAIKQPAIPKGACGMILWTLESERPTPIFRYVDGKSAEMTINGTAKEFQLERRDGASGFGVFEQQDFLAEGGLSVKVAVAFGLGFDGGSYLERGVISITDATGWKLVTPAAGIAGCRAK